MPRKPKPPPKKKIIAPGVYRVIAGKGFAKRPIHYVSFGATTFPPEEKFWDHIAAEERKAIKILEKAGLPTDPLSFYTLPEGKVAELTTDPGQLPKIGTLAMLAVSRGYRQLDTPEWYAAVIIKKAALLRESVERVSGPVRIQRPLLAQMAYELGILVTEAKALGYYKEKGAKGGAKERRKHPVVLLVQYLMQQHEKGTALELWEDIFEDYDIQIEGYKFWRNEDRLFFSEKVNGHWKETHPPLLFRSFRKKVTEARKLTTR